MAIESPPTSRWPIFPYGPIDDLIAAINRAIERAVREREERLKRADGGREISKLTDRELQMPLRIVKGMQNKEMAEEYGLSERTNRSTAPSSPGGSTVTRRSTSPGWPIRLFFFLIRDARHDTILLQGRFGHFTGP